MMMQELTTLQNALPGMAAKDAAFARSLLQQAADKGSLSEKQMFWVKKLAAKPAAPKTSKVALDLGVIFKLFTTAGGKQPAITFGTCKEDTVRLSVAGPQARVPGSINVTEAGSFAGRAWFGRITTDGMWEPCRKIDDQRMAQVEAALAAFAADPVGQAKAYGDRTGSCCFCAHALTEEHSKALGYGPDCAHRWGMPHSYSGPVLSCQEVAA